MWSVAKSAEGYELRPVTEEEIPTLHGLVRALAEFEELSSSVVSTAEDLRRGFFGSGAIAEAVIAWQGDAAVGFAIWYETFSTFRGRKGLYLEDLYVASEHRGRGLGQALMRHVARVAVERDYCRLEWEVLRWNTRAIEFYESLGGKSSGEWELYTLSGEELMRVASNC